MSDRKVLLKLRIAAGPAGAGAPPEYSFAKVVGLIVPKNKEVGL